jgi:hypothetical protein
MSFLILTLNFNKVICFKTIIVQSKLKRLKLAIFCQKDMIFINKIYYPYEIS